MWASLLVFGLGITAWMHLSIRWSAQRIAAEAVKYAPQYRYDYVWNHACWTLMPTTMVANKALDMLVEQETRRAEISSMPDYQ